MERNFIAIYDLSPERKILYLSDSVYDVLGYTPDELIGQSGFCLIPEEELPGMQTYILYQEINDSIISLLYGHSRTKTNQLIPIEAAASCCYNMVTCVIAQVDPNSHSAKARAAAAESVVYIDDHPNGMFKGAWKVQGSSVKELPDPDIPTEPIKLEPRACMVLNRFTRKLTIMYCSVPASFILGINPTKCTGGSFVSYLHPEDSDYVVQEIDRVKSTSCVAQTKFRFISPTKGVIPVSLTVTASCDGLIAVLQSAAPS
ncbi:hypothetical protein K493DRAFT_311083 [Basidiobolus meristosporus CBS 931.73]|uniref:PAS domain-containing protein n=1 Tax=Basidiobolus meristosporus CBS 931.73 TaxID=1314790 RepID=A0A1Y1Z4B0_9FUNG|nr:hypothetical protein K493DRAFT_311083 [Basidiobolus meristosporus CBS 931.73]|eukprot:ORY05093.1 hypothetical protein K493DRAFT_311083 [Basidiobolus meristosporus CBS 931.73]